jgi:teichuronic acid biosynthesis glycosyltransferase TuaC
MRALTLTPFYPTASDDAMGCFIAEPVCALEKCGVSSSVIAVQPFYRRPASPNGHPAQWVRYASLPGGLGLASAGAFLYSTLLNRIRALHRDRHFDLIHAHAALPCGHAAMLLSRELRLPFVITVHGRDAFFRRQVRGVPGRWCERVARSVYRSAAKVICISRKVAKELGDAAANIEIIHNGADPEQFCPKETESSRARILAVGNLIPSKGHELLLRAIAGLPNRIQNPICEIIGDGPERLRLIQLAEELGIRDRVQFLGRKSRNEVAAAMQGCTVFALPSHYEGLGCVYLEAMAAGKPVIACRNQGIEEIISHGVNGWLIEPGDLSALTEALALFLGDSGLGQRIGNTARETILDRYTVDHQAAQLARIYRECLV